MPAPLAIEPRDVPFSFGVEASDLFTIPVGVIGVNPACAILRVRGVTDRITFGVSGLEPLADVPAYPVTISWALCAGLACGLDQRKFVSGLVPNVMNLVDAEDARVGLLWEVTGLLVSQWVLFAAVTSPSPKFRAKIGFITDCDGGGPYSVYTGGAFG